MAKHYLTNGQFYSFNAFGVTADAVEIENGRITRIGRIDEILPSVPKASTIINLNGSFVLPGFTDSHIHLLGYGLSLQRVNVSAASKQACLARVAERVAETSSGEWIIGHGWDHTIWEGGFGTRADLDAVSEQHPIYLTHKSLHCGWANSSALRVAGITSETPDPLNGTIVREDRNTPNGILLENAMRLLESKIPEPNESMILSALYAAQEALNRFGITSAHDFDPWPVFAGLQKMEESGALSLRITKGIPENFLDQALDAGLKSGVGGDWIKIGWLKLFADGALGPRTAAMLSPYENTEDCGMLFLDEAAVVHFGKVALPCGIALAVHAIGDRANRTVLSALKSLQAEGYLDIPAIPSRIEHCQALSLEDMPLFRKHNIIASMQPIHAVSDMQMAESFWGDRCQTAYAWRSLLDQGAHLVFGSDAPVESPNPFYGIAAALSRRKIPALKPTIKEGWTAHQCISLNDALKAYCCIPPQVGGYSTSLGTIKPGMLADLIFLPGDFLMRAPDELHEVELSATMVGGNWVYKNDKIDIE